VLSEVLALSVKLPRTIVLNRATDYWRATGARTQAGSGIDTTAALEQIADPESDLNPQWDEQHDHYVLWRLLSALQDGF
jgi:hypothetical protein